MLIDAIVMDDEGIPFTPERFSHEPEAAQRFLELMESNTYGHTMPWRDLPMDMVVYEASRRLHQVQQDLAIANDLRSRDKLS